MAENTQSFSAVLDHFRVRLQAEQKTPIGLINTSRGGALPEPGTTHEGKSGGMSSGMLAPLVPFPVRGFTRYQGETTVLQQNGLASFDKMQNLIGGWRKAGGTGRLPFSRARIAPWGGRYEGDELCTLWEAQAAALTISGTGMAVTTGLVDVQADDDRAIVRASPGLSVSAVSAPTSPGSRSV